MTPEEKINFVRKIIFGGQKDFQNLSPISKPVNYFDKTKGCLAYFESLGLDLLRDHKIAIVMPAGGLSTRMGGEGLRGNLPIGPVSERSIFQLQAEKIAAIKKAYSPKLLWLIMTSSGVHEQTVESFQKNNFWGISPKDVCFFQQESLPILTKTGEPAISEQGTLLESPTGHGGFFEALKNTTILDRLIEGKIEYLFYFQYPNVLENICDPCMLGYHLQGGFDVTTKAFMGYLPEEKLGKIAEIHGKMKIIEYHYVEKNINNSFWNLLPANMATHVWSVKFLNRCIKEEVRLPYHVVLHKGGPEKKLEQFIFDLMDYCESFGLITVDRDLEFSPVKTKTGIYSLKYSRLMLNRLYLNWLKEAGAVLPNSNEEEIMVEISPSFALSPDELAEKLPKNFKIQNGMILK